MTEHWVIEATPRYMATDEPDFQNTYIPWRLSSLLVILVYVYKEKF